MAPSPLPLDCAVERLEAEIAALRERLGASSRILEERRLARLLAHTPLADHDFGMARDRHRGLRDRLLAAQAHLGALILEREERSGDLRAG
jgi:hypothetical protein